MKSIIIEINTEGEVIIETTGFKGEACLKATQAMEQALGVPVTRTKKPEFNATVAATQKVGAR